MRDDSRNLRASSTVHELRRLSLFRAFGSFAQLGNITGDQFLAHCMVECGPQRAPRGLNHATARVILTAITDGAATTLFAGIFVLCRPLGIFALRAALADTSQRVKPCLSFPDGQLVYPPLPHAWYYVQP